VGGLGHKGLEVVAGIGVCGVYIDADLLEFLLADHLDFWANSTRT
jgi:hypothetical protein